MSPRQARPLRTARYARRRGPNYALLVWPLLLIAGVVGVFAFTRPSTSQEPGTAAPSGPLASIPLLQPAATPTPSPSPTPAATATPVPPPWLTTTRETGLWSSPEADAAEFTTIPSGSALRWVRGPTNGRVLVQYPGDGGTRQPGQAWVTQADTAPGSVPAWIQGSAIPESGRPAGSPLAPSRASLVAPPKVSAAQIAVVDDATGLLLYGLDPHAPEAPASTTKIATASVALERAPDLARTIKITVDGAAMAARDGSSIMGLVPGQTLTVRTLLYGLLLPSGNDAAEQLAASLADTRAEYVGWMNDLVARLGLHDTHFLNPSGLDEDGHAASAYDLAQLARNAMRNPTFRTIVATPSYAAQGYKLVGHNPLLGVYPGVDGVKTGSTDAAGHTIVASATRDGHRVYVVLMHSDDLEADGSALFDWAWRAFQWPPSPDASPSLAPSAAPRSTR